MSLALPRFLSAPTRLTSMNPSAQLRRFAGGALIGLGVLISAFSLTPATASANVTADAQLADGMHVFGESPDANQLGVTYMTLEVTAGQVVGGFYQVSSSFDCFHGHVSGNDLALQLAASFEQPESTFSLALESQTAVAAQGTVAATWVPTGFHSVAEVTETDHQVLQACTTQI
ncbi:MAG: hypothetical protein ACFBSG_16995 [Leptolyngbyaceae cyanobacterium]